MLIINNKSSFEWICCKLKVVDSKNVGEGMEGRGEMKLKSYLCVSVFVLLLCICFFKQHYHHSLEVWKTMLTGSYTEWKSWGRVVKSSFILIYYNFFPYEKWSIRQSKGELLWGECLQALLPAHTAFLSRVCPQPPIPGGQRQEWVWTANPVTSLHAFWSWFCHLPIV